MAERIEVTVEQAQSDFERLLEVVSGGVEVVIVREDGFRVELVPADKVETG